MEQGLRHASEEGTPAGREIVSPAGGVTQRALGWLQAHVDRFNPFRSTEGASEARQTALAELALFCFELAQNPKAHRRAEALWKHARGVLVEAYQRPELHRFILDGPEQAFTGHLLLWLATPREISGRLLPRRTLQGVFDHRGIARVPRPPMRLFELRYFLDYSGLRHSLPAPRQLLDAALRPVGQDPESLDARAVYDLTHIVFYATHFGRRPGAVLSQNERSAVASLTQILLERFIQQEHWDLVAELILARRCLCLPGESQATAAAWNALAQAQYSDGSYGERLLQQILLAQGLSPELAADSAFLRSYHPCLVTALAGLLPEPLV